jgi:beta-lactamase class D
MKPFPIMVAAMVTLVPTTARAEAPTSAGDAIGAVTEQMVRDEFKGYDSAFVVFDTKSKKYFRFNKDGCERRLSPCSTFKIFNALVGVETGVVKEDTVFKWDGVKHEIASHNQDQTLQSAMTNSAVWCFQKIAAQVGEKRMKHYLQAVGYGNQDMSAGLTKFWLGNSLKISANEEVEFLRRLNDNDLPFSQRTMDIVKSVIKLNETPTSTLFGKTGTDGENKKLVLGWFVGYVVRKDRSYVFATNIRAKDDAYGKIAKKHTLAILQKTGMM